MATKLVAGCTLQYNAEEGKGANKKVVRKSIRPGTDISEVIDKIAPAEADLEALMRNGSVVEEEIEEAPPGEGDVLLAGAGAGDD